MCRVFSCVVGRGCLLWLVHSLGKTVRLCLASFCTPRTNLPVTPGISWLPTFAFQSPMMKRTSFFGVLEGLVGLHRTIELQLLQHYWLGHRLGLLSYWTVCLGNKQRSFCHFWDCTKHCISDSFVDYECYSISSKGFLPTVVDIMVIWIKFAHSSPCSLIPKMLMFTLAISCLTSFNSPWFMDLIFHILMQYCSVEHRTVLPSPVTFATWCESNNIFLGTLMWKTESQMFLIFMKI